MKRLAVLAAIALWSLPAMPADILKCGGATVSLEFMKSSLESYGKEAVLTVSRGKRMTILRYDMDIDFIGAACRKNKEGQPMIVYQAYCGGSGCNDGEYYGIVDPEDLRVLLVPSGRNSRDAARILGTKVSPIGVAGMYSVDTEKVGRQ